VGPWRFGELSQFQIVLVPGFRVGPWRFGGLSQFQIVLVSGYAVVAAYFVCQDQRVRNFRNGRRGSLFRGAFAVQ